MSWQIRHVTHESPEQEKQGVLRFWSGDYAWATRSRLEAPWGDEVYGFVGAFAGYRKVARLERQVKVGTDYYDLTVYEKKI